MIFFIKKTKSNQKNLAGGRGGGVARVSVCFVFFSKRIQVCDFFFELVKVRDE